jgi:hypothetical protein
VSREWRRPALCQPQAGRPATPACVRAANLPSPCGRASTERGRVFALSGVDDSDPDALDFCRLTRRPPCANITRLQEHWPGSGFLDRLWYLRSPRLPGLWFPAPASLPGASQKQANERALRKGSVLGGDLRGCFAGGDLSDRSHRRPHPWPGSLRPAGRGSECRGRLRGGLDCGDGAHRDQIRGRVSPRGPGEGRQDSGAVFRRDRCGGLRIDGGAVRGCGVHCGADVPDARSGPGLQGGLLLRAVFRNERLSGGRPHRAGGVQGDGLWRLCSRARCLPPSLLRSQGGSVWWGEPARCP